ncbi:non-ribosomal peptide synthetase [Paenibacillus xylaniclasticus]|uniref:non-ribosomal peptide synthetase n=1 Tax=Paenibacillus xylaniclasticus TaxID=588083 RepID=UPI0013E01341|nr:MULTISPECIES: non-ribosomal peptide synthetase [Paenibacillus]GFN33009.1 surfactin synthase subunit 3 [Paenibacillus curdlanolyticus]
MSEATKLDRASIEDITALTPVQEGMLFHYRSGKHEGSYAQQLSIRLEGMLNMEALSSAWQQVARVNEMLRTVFRWEKLEHPVQIVLREPNIPISEKDCSASSSKARERLVHIAREEELSKPIDLTTHPLRVLVCKLNEHSFEMIVSWHHILFDGWSNGVLINELLTAYDAFAAGNKAPIVRKTRFKQFVAWHQQANREANRNFWMNELADLGDRTTLPIRHGTDYKADRRRVSGSVAAPLIQDTIINLSDYARRLGVTPASVLYAAWALLLYKYSGAPTVVFGTTVSGRTPEIEGVEQMVGLFINTVPLRVELNDEAEVEQVIQSVDAALRRREPYDSSPLMDIASWSGANGAEELFETIVVLDNYPLDTAMLKSSRLTVVGYRMQESTHYPLTLGINTFGEWRVELEYDASSFSEESIKRMVGHYQYLLYQTLLQPQQKVSELELITASEKERILTVLNQPIRKPLCELVHHIFEERARTHPDLPAVISGGRSYTYGSIDARSDIMARRLRRETFTSGERLVALLAERSEQWIVAMLAILKAGCGYIPIDAAYAPARIAYMLEDSAAELLLIGDGVEVPTSFTGRIIRLEEAEACSDDDEDNFIKQEITSEQIAYVTYTSGSTGAPKGVMTEHRQLLAYVLAFQREFGLGPGDVVLQQASCSFDHFVEEVYPALLSGAAIVIAQREEVLDPDRLLQLLQTYQVTFVTVQPLLLSELNKRGGVPSVHTYLSGGDVLKAVHYDRLIENARVYNTYGPTEATVCAAYWQCDRSKETSIPIGSPIAGYNIYITDRNGRLMPIGIPGEICIAGNGVARGYLHNAELTNSKFIPDPYRPGKRMYRTGDVGVWQEDGTIRFEGRTDEQVKIRGYRIDLSEIELALQAHPAIGETVVLAAEDAAGEKHIAAYLVTLDELTAFELREHLTHRLPAHMFPSVYYRIPSIPRTSNDKVDKKALLLCTDRLPSGTRCSEAASNTEKAIIAIWREVLKLDDIGPDDHFFDIGGNSLLLMTLQSKLERTFSAGITVTDLFSMPTVGKQAAWLDSRRKRMEVFAIDGYQRMPEECFRGHAGASDIYAAEDPITMHVPSSIARALYRLASEYSVERIDIMAAMWGYWFAEAIASRTSVFHITVNGGHEALPIRIDLDTAHNFPGLFAHIAKARKAAAAEPDSAVRTTSTDTAVIIPLQRIGRFTPERDAFETMSLVCRSEELLHHDRTELIGLYDWILIIDERTSHSDELDLMLLYRKGRYQPETPEWLIQSYFDLLRQLSGIEVAT